MKRSRLCDGQSRFPVLNKLMETILPTHNARSEVAADVFVHCLVGKWNRVAGSLDTPLCWSMEKAKNPRGSGGQRPPGAAARPAAWNSARASTGGNRGRKDRVSRFPPIDPVGNGNGKGSLFAGWRRDERPLVPVRQIVSHLWILAKTCRVHRTGAI